MNSAGEISIRAELARKGIHLFALIIPVGYSLVTFPTAIAWVGASAATAIFIDLSRFYRWSVWKYFALILTPIIREHEVKGGFTGASYILTTALMAIIFFPKPIAIAAMMFIIIGDTAAALVGRKYGRHRLKGKKTVEGSAACFITLFLVSFFIPGLPTLVAFTGAVTATVAEAISGKIDDNLTVPVSSGLVMLLVMHLMGYQGATFFGAVQW